MASPLHVRTVAGVTLLLGIASLCIARPATDFNGTWVFKFNGQSIFKLTVAADKLPITGSLTKPKKLSIEQNGDVTSVGPEQVTLPIQKASLFGDRLELTIDGNPFVFTIDDRGQASLTTEGMRPWRLERAAPGEKVVLASRLSEPAYTPEIRALRERLRAMVSQDQGARMAFNQQGSEAADAANRAEVLRIFERHGWVTNSLAGKDAAHNFWLLVQHQDSKLQQRLLPALEKAAKAGDASMTDYAYLYDRVQMGLNKPQHWGTQAKCENGKPVLYPVDDLAGLDARRKELFMAPVADYLKMDYLVRSCRESRK